MDIELHGAGRAAGALGLAAVRSGHTITSVHGRSERSRDDLASLLQPSGGVPELRIIAVSDDAIADVAEALAGEASVPTVHVSGSVTVDVLAPLAGAPIGSFHPLQTLPDPEAGAARLAGAWIAVTADEPFASVLHELELSLGPRPFRLADADKPLYHAAAAASANFTLAALALAERLAAEAGVPFEATRPLVDAIVANAFTLGPGAALTGPIARGDVGTVERQIAAVTERTPGELATFRDMARATARIAGASDAVRGAIE